MEKEDAGSRGGNVPVTVAHVERVQPDAPVASFTPELRDSCNALIGLIQLVCGRDDMPPDIKRALLCSHRMDEAYAALQKAEGNP